MALLPRGARKAVSRQVGQDEAVIYLVEIDCSRAPWGTTNSRDPAPEKAVHERGFSDIRTTSEGYFGEVRSRAPTLRLGHSSQKLD
jgi:hypothetical protein